MPDHSPPTLQGSTISLYKSQNEFMAKTSGPTLLAPPPDDDNEFDFGDDSMFDDLVDVDTPQNHEHSSLHGSETTTETSLGPIEDTSTSGRDHESDLPDLPPSLPPFVSCDEYEDSESSSDDQSYIVIHNPLPAGQRLDDMTYTERNLYFHKIQSPIAFIKPPRKHPRNPRTRLQVRFKPKKNEIQLFHASSSSETSDDESDEDEDDMDSCRPDPCYDPWSDSESEDLSSLDLDSDSEASTNTISHLSRVGGSEWERVQEKLRRRELQDKFRALAAASPPVTPAPSAGSGSTTPSLAPPPLRLLPPPSELDEDTGHSDDIDPFADDFDPESVKSSPIKPAISFPPPPSLDPPLFDDHTDGFDSIPFDPDPLNDDSNTSNIVSHDEVKSTSFSSQPSNNHHAQLPAPPFSGGDAGFDQEHTNEHDEMEFHFDAGFDDAFDAAFDDDNGHHIDVHDQHSNVSSTNADLARFQPSQPPIQSSLQPSLTQNTLPDAFIPQLFAMLDLDPSRENNTHTVVGSTHNTDTSKDHSKVDSHIDLGFILHCILEPQPDIPVSVLTKEAGGSASMELIMSSESSRSYVEASMRADELASALESSQCPSILPSQDGIPVLEFGYTADSSLNPRDQHSTADGSLSTDSDTLGDDQPSFFDVVTDTLQAIIDDHNSLNELNEGVCKTKNILSGLDHEGPTPPKSFHPHTHLSSRRSQSTYRNADQQDGTSRIFPQHMAHQLMAEIAMVTTEASAASTSLLRHPLDPFYGVLPTPLDCLPPPLDVPLVGDAPIDQIFDSVVEGVIRASESTAATTQSDATPLQKGVDSVMRKRTTMTNSEPTIVEKSATNTSSTPETNPVQQPVPVMSFDSIPLQPVDDVTRRNPPAVPISPTNTTTIAAPATTSVHHDHATSADITRDTVDQEDWPISAPSAPDAKQQQSSIGGPATDAGFSAAGDDNDDDDDDDFTFEADFIDDPEDSFSFPVNPSIPTPSSPVSGGQQESQRLPDVQDTPLNDSIPFPFDDDHPASQRNIPPPSSQISLPVSNSSISPVLAPPPPAHTESTHEEDNQDESWNADFSFPDIPFDADFDSENHPPDTNDPPASSFFDDDF